MARKIKFELLTAHRLKIEEVEDLFCGTAKTLAQEGAKILEATTVEQGVIFVANVLKDHTAVEWQTAFQRNIRQSFDTIVRPVASDTVSTNGAASQIQRDPSAPPAAHVRPFVIWELFCFKCDDVYERDFYEDHEALQWAEQNPYCPDCESVKTP